MTPKEKAEQLIETFRMNVLDYEGCGINDHKAKQCALIAVDEIIRTTPMIRKITEVSDDKGVIWKLVNNTAYWLEVKQEIVEQQKQN